MAPIGVEPRRQYAAFTLFSAQHDSASAIAKQHAGATIFPIEDPTEGFRSDHQCLVGASAANHVVGDCHCIEKAGAHRLHIKGDAVGNAEIGLDDGCRGREGLVGRRCGEHDQVDIGGINAGCFQRAFRSTGSQAGRRFAVIGNMPAMDAGTLDNPFV